MNTNRRIFTPGRLLVAGALWSLTYFPLAQVAQQHAAQPLLPDTVHARAADHLTVRRIPPPKGSHKTMNFIVSGAGTGAWNGTYVQTGTANGKPAYELDASHWAFWDGANWGFDTSIIGGGSSWAYFHSTNFGATLPTGSGYTSNVGTAPAPTVTGSGTPVNQSSFFTVF